MDLWVARAITPILYKVSPPSQSKEKYLSGLGGGARSLRKDALVHHSSSFFASKANESMNSNPKLVNH